MIKRKYIIKNMLIDCSYPLIFWGIIYFSLVIINFWSVDMYISWYLAMLLFTPFNILGGRAINIWRKKTGYEYKGYE